ncbi:MAG: hypothetical protein NTZ93_03740 [Candidatus Beckwithbacteria bacterium]|nr:hypothetical protein [Candidatus Beckwithbacteria bacterium]
MKLTNLLTRLTNKKEETKTEYFFAVEITEDIIKSSVWTVVNGHTEVVKTGPVKNWDGQNQEKLLAGVDESVSLASQNLSPQPSGVIFGLPDSWVDKDNINPEKKAYLKPLCESLELKPLGFVITNTAVVQYLKIEEGSPVSAIFLQLNSTEINLSLVKLGKVIGSEVVGRSGDLGADVEEGLSRFKDIDTLPSRMILYDGKNDFEEDKQQLTSYDWEEKLPFIHFPKVEVLPLEASIKAVSLAGGSEVAKSLGFEIKEKEPGKEEVKETLGFTNQDIALVQPEPKPEPKIEPKTETKINLIQLIKVKLFSLKLPHFKLKFPRLNLIIPGFVILLILVFYAYWYLPKAQVTLYFEPKNIDQAFTITASTDAKIIDVAKATLPAETVDISVSGSQSLPTTGTKLIGNPAAGDITIYNKTSQAKTFTQATVLIDPSNLTFTLDEDTTIASSSSQESSEGVITITPGKANAKITAKSIGAEGNLANDTRLVFKQFSEADFYAKTSGLSNGSSQEVKAVSQADQDQLLTNLTNQLINQAQTDLQSRLGNDKRSMTIKGQDKLTSKNFNHNVGEQADNLTLEAKLDYQTLSYSQKDLLTLLSAFVQDKIPADFIIGSTNDAELTAVKMVKNTATASVDFQIQLLPKLDLPAIKAKIKGRYPQAIQPFLTSLPSFLKADIIIKPSLPKALKTLPHVAKNITLEIKN